MSRILLITLIAMLVWAGRISSAPKSVALSRAGTTQVGADNHTIQSPMSQSSIYLPLVAQAQTPTATLLATQPQTPTATPSPTQLQTPTPTPSLTQPQPQTPTATSSPTTQPTTQSTPTGSWWQPKPDQPIHWHWQLSQEFVHPRDTNALSPNIRVYDIDGEYTSAATVQALKERGQAEGKTVIVICYIDVGVYETYRSDAWKFEEAHAIKPLWGNADQGWEGSYWLDIRQTDVLLPIMEARIRDWCKAKGFDAVEPDESEVWSNDPGFPITLDENIAYSRMIADLVHSYGLSVGLKGNNAEAAHYEPFSDWSLTEECFQYDECDVVVNAFIPKGKAVFNIEYAADPDCAWANANHMNSAKRDLNLMGPTHKQYLYQPCVPDDQDHW
jgi:hypothetical protein